MAAAMSQQIAPWLLSGLPLLGALLTLGLWSRPTQMKNLAVAIAVMSFAAIIVLTSLLPIEPQNILLLYLLPLAACASILGQPVEARHRSAWVITLLLLGLGLAVLTHQGMMGSFFMLAIFGLLISLLYRHASVLWPISWRGIALFFLGAIAAAVSAMANPPLASIGSLLASAILLPLVPLHEGYLTALTRLPGNLPSFIVVLLPALGLHGLATSLPTAPNAVARTIMIFALIGALYGAVKALAQSRISLLLAYGSLSFFSILWWFAAATQIITPDASVFVSAVSLGASGLLIAWQAIRTRYGDDVDPTAISGLVSTMPRYAVLLSLIALAAMGLPPFGVYTGFMGLALASPLASSVALFGLLAAWLMASWYILEAVQNLLFGRQRAELRSTDLLRFEAAALLIVVLTVLALGVVPAQWFIHQQFFSSTGAFMGWFAWPQ
jgi:NADH-quinone oxidoreductase subunit M